MTAAGAAAAIAVPARWSWLVTVNCALLAYVASSSGMALQFDLIVQAVISDRWRYQWVTGSAVVIHLLAQILPQSATDTHGDQNHDATNTINVVADDNALTVAFR